MSKRDEIQAEIVKAAKGREKDRLSVLRFLMSAIKNREIELKRNLEDEEVLQVIASLIRKGQESLEQFKAGGRQDLIDKEESEIATLRSFMPPQLSEEEVEAVVVEVIEGTGASGMRDMGKVMKEVISRIKGRADGKVVSTIVKNKLRKV